MTSIETDDREVEISRPDKELFGEGGITKLDLADYYARVADRMLGYLTDRPLVMLRAPDGIDAHRFFQKDVPDHFPQWIERVELAKEEGGSVAHVLARDAATLVYLADQACVELHALLSRADRPNQPDQLIFDLDPSTDELDPVRHAASAVRDVLADVGLAAFAKSSGSRGIHVHVPAVPEIDFDEARELSRRLAERVVATDPDSFTVAQRRDERGDRVFIDTLRNSYAQHAVVPYGVRAHPAAPVAVPLDWDEATAADFDPQAFTVTNVFRRLGQKDDPWAGYEDARVSLVGFREQLGE